MSDFTIYSDDVGKVRRLMLAYQASVKAEYIVLCHRDGSIIAEVGSLGIDATPLAVLSTASLNVPVGFLFRRESLDLYLPGRRGPVAGTGVPGFPPAESH